MQHTQKRHVNLARIFSRRPLGVLAVLALISIPVKVNAMTISTSVDRMFAAAPAPRPLCNDAPCIIDRYVNPFINTFSALAGIAVVASIIYGGIQYSSAGGDSSKVGAAKSRIGKSIGALVFFIFLYAFLNYLVPGGVGN